MKIETKNAAPDIQHKSVVTEFKAQSDGTFEGYASVFNNKDSYGDIVRPGAYTKTLMERGNKVKVLYNHNWDNLIGTPKQMKEDTYGLWVQAQIITALSLGKDVLELMRAGALSEMSIGYQAIKYNYLSDDTDSYWPGRELLEVKLFEFSPVTFAANELAAITGVKSGRDLEARLNALEAEIKFWTQIRDADFKAGKVLNSRNAQRILSAYKELGDVITEANLEAVSEDTSSDEKRQKPVKSTSVLTELQSYRKSMDLEARKTDIASKIHSFAQSLKEG